MRDSSTYREIHEEGQRQQLKWIILRLGEKRFGPAGEEVRATIAALADLEHLYRVTDQLQVAGRWQELLATE